MKNHVIICEDNFEISNYLSKLLYKENYTTTTYTTGEECLEAYNNKTLCVLLDINLPQMNGLDVLKKLKQKDPNSKIIIMTAHSSIEQTVQAMRLGAENYLAKPFENKSLIASLQSIKEIDSLFREENGESELYLKTKSQIMEKFYQNLNKISESEANVLLLGESGTGKEGFAKLLHTKSLRNKEIFIPVDCASIPHNIFESEMFGHKAGAFTGAIKDKIGRFERAHRGTLFLDEVADIDSASQAKLLRTIQTGDFERLGDSKTTHADVRIISATSKNLDASDSHFRKDLYYRLAEVLLEVPALRDRKEDIPTLSDFLIEKLCIKNKRSTLTLSTEAKDKLSQYLWPGNIRELRSILHRLVILTPKDQNKIGKIPDEYLADINSKDPTYKEMTSVKTEEPALGLSSIEEDIIVNMLKKHNNNISKTAKILGIGRSTLYRKLKKRSNTN